MVTKIKPLNGWCWLGGNVIVWVLVGEVTVGVEGGEVESVEGTVVTEPSVRFAVAVLLQPLDVT